MDIAVWLRELGLERYEEAFRENEVGLDVLPKLTAEDLKEIGVIPVGDRRRLLEAIAALAEEGEPKSDAAKQPRKPAEAERRQLTVMFVDLVGSTELSERFDPEDLSAIIRAFQDCCAGVITRYEGYIAKYMGDGVLIYFGYPQAHEDDAERALRVGLELIEAVGALAPRADLTLQLRVGIATGPVVVGEVIGEGQAQEQTVVGETPNLAARLQALAETDTVVIAENTRRLVGDAFEYADLGRHRLKGFSEPAQAWRVVGLQVVETRFEATHRSTLTALVGRESELSLLLERWRQARAGEGQVVLLSGEAGIGKSRMTQALRERIADEPHVRLSYQCSPYHSNSALYPVISQLERAAGFDAGDSAVQKLDKLEALLARGTEQVSTIAPLFGALLSIPCEDRYPALELTPQVQRQQTREALLAQLLGLARQRPVLFVLEDAHWIDPSTRELVDLAVSRLQAIPVLMVITFRRELTAPWAGHAHSTQLSLNRLGQQQIAALIEHVSGGRTLPGDVFEQIVAKTDGVPLFVEELTKTVLESGLLHDAGDRYELAGPLPLLAIPASLQDSLMARLDRLASLKHVAQAAACIGREFAIPLLEQALKRTSLEQDLEQFLDAGLIFRRGIGEGETYVFKHALVQDAAYESLLVSTRRQLHARIAQALEGSPDTEPGVLARHYSAAGVAEKAASYFLVAGRQALSVSALLEASTELEMGLREIETLPPSSARDRLELDLRIALGAARIAYRGWGHRSVGDAYEPTFALVQKLEDREALGPILWGLCIHYSVRAEFPQTHHWLTKLENVADSAEDSELSVVRDMMAGCQYFWEAEYERAYRYTAHIRMTYDEHRHAHITAYTNHDPLCFSLHWAGSLLQWIIGHPDRALELIDEAHVLARRINHPFNLAFALTAGSEALLMRGDIERVLRHCDEVQRIVDESGLNHMTRVVDNYRGRVQTRLGCFETARRLLAGTRKSGTKGGICSAMWWGDEAIALGGLRRTREAVEMIDAAIAHCRNTGDRYMEPEVLRMKAELMLAAEKSTSDAAEATLLEALQISRDHKARSWELRVATSLAKLWRSQDKDSKARDLLAPIYEWFTEGFDTADLKDAKALLGELN